MADNATFSSFRRPAQPAPVPAQDPPHRIVIAEGWSAAEPRPTPEAALTSPTQDGLHIERWADITAPAIACDQLGLANPACITLQAALPGSTPVRLDADASGTYRPPGLNPAPWSPAMLGAGWDGAATDPGCAPASDNLLRRDEKSA